MQSQLAKCCMWVCHSVGSASSTTSLATLYQTKTSMHGCGILSIMNTWVPFQYMSGITCQLFASPHYISLSSSHNFSQAYIELLLPKPGPIGGSLLVLVKGGALGCGAPWRLAAPGWTAVAGFRLIERCSLRGNRIYK